MLLLTRSGRAVFQHGEVVPPVECVGSRVLDTDVSGYACQHKFVDSLPLQLFVQGRVCEGIKGPLLEDEILLFWGQLLDYLGALGPFH